MTTLDGRQAWIEEDLDWKMTLDLCCKFTFETATTAVLTLMPKFLFYSVA